MNSINKNNCSSMIVHTIFCKWHSLPESFQFPNNLTLVHFLIFHLYANPISLSKFAPGNFIYLNETFYVVNAKTLSYKIDLVLRNEPQKMRKSQNMRHWFFYSTEHSIPPWYSVTVVVLTLNVETCLLCFEWINK